jgi:N-acetylmuramoyl-L-alanine amidase
VSKLAVLFFCGALAVLAGCATSSNETPPPNWSATNDVQQVEKQTSFEPIPLAVRTNGMATIRTNSPLVTRTNLPPIVKTNVPPAMRTNLPPAARANVPPATNVFKPRPAPIYTWTSLARWAAERKINPPLLLSRSPLFAYSIASARGVMVLAIGSREATWNGVTLHLGYAPEFIDGEVYLHGLDLQKSLQPFLCDAPPVYGTNRVIVIDPGHGGMNAGTLGVGDRRPEKEFTLDWARRLQPLLAQEGWQVFLTRTNDVDVALSNRVAMADSRHADLFVSLHFNSAAPDSKPVGLATFCLTPVGMPSTITREYPDALFQNFPDNNYDAENIQLAEHLQRALLHASGMEDRGVNRARFIGVLRGQHRPAVLIEAGFLSNPHEAKRIEDPDFRQKLAEAVATALK